MTPDLPPRPATTSVQPLHTPPPHPGWDGNPSWPPAPGVAPYQSAIHAPAVMHQQTLAGGDSGIRSDQQPSNAAAITIAWLLAIFTLGYMLPWAIAATRGKANHGAIAALNLLLGWTFVGWIVALVMACASHQVVAGGATFIVAQQFNAPEPIPNGPPPGWYPSPDQAGRQYWDGRTWTGHRAP